ncbi:MAG: GNAT family N-acetyltransferase [Leptolyngbya sp. SIO1D8]|nr:GNAT family N-acetyltransferase [Leptolyngbya sp. SIO1D8]
MTFSSEFLPHTTERLVLRRFVPADLDAFLAYRQDPEVARYQSWSSLSRDAAIALITEMHTATMGVPGQWFQIAIVHRVSNRLVGDIGLQLASETPALVEIGFTLARAEQHKGYAGEAVQAVMSWLFEVENQTKVVAIVDQRNQPSINLLQRLGMTLVRSDKVTFKGELCIEQTFELSQENWLRHPAPMPPDAPLS